MRFLRNAFLFILLSFPALLLPNVFSNSNHISALAPVFSSSPAAHAGILSALLPLSPSIETCVSSLLLCRRGKRFQLQLRHLP